MVLMTKDGKSEYVADIFIPLFRKNGYVVVGEEKQEETVSKPKNTKNKSDD